MRGERMAKRSSFGSIMRRRLSDITNSEPQPKVSSQEKKPSQISPATEDFISQLIKEKMTLLQIVEERKDTEETLSCHLLFIICELIPKGNDSRNKIIELSGAELQNLRISIQKLQLQNWNLAQTNSQILGELNLGRGKLKALQHELTCKNALLKAKNSKEVKADMSSQKTENLDLEETAAESLKKAKDDDKPRKNRRRSARSQSMGHFSTHQQVTEKEKVENKRPRLRRQSARFISQKQEELTENLFEIEDAKFSITQKADTPMHEHSLAPSAQRSSIGRPLRRAVEKVQSYREVPINVKMRRSE